VMLCMCAGGSLWNEAKAGNPAYDQLVGGWAKWNAKHSGADSPGITESDYPHVNFFDTCINPPALRRVLLTMLNPDPHRRVTMAEVANNRWLKNVECCQIDSYDDPTTVIDASKANTSRKTTKVVHHNHLPPTMHLGHRLVRLPGSTDMW
jgi:protein-serine/threonine kinase